MSSQPRVGLHDFINSKPILHAFEHGLIETPFELVIDTPARLADRFRDGELDIALIPSIEYARIPEAVILPTFCIASLGRVGTVLLFSELGIEDIESVCVDQKSRTSVAMLQILFKEMYRKDITLTTGEDDPAMMLRSADAGLVIGDNAFGIDHDKYVVHDLGELWFEYSGRPFVHAVLCARQGTHWDAAIAALEEAKRVGLKSKELVARQEGKTAEQVETFIDYLNARIFYDLGESERDGLQHFLKLAHTMNLCPRSDLSF